MLVVEGDFAVHQEVVIVGLGDQEAVVADAGGLRADGKCGSSASCGFGSTRPFRPLHATLPNPREAHDLQPFHNNDRGEVSV